MSRPGFADVTHFERHKHTFNPVWETEDGRKPSADGDGKWNTKDGKEPTGDVRTFRLVLGNADDDNDKVRKFNETAADADKVVMPTVEVPNWALAHYKNVPTFALKLANQGRSRGLAVSRAA